MRSRKASPFERPHRCRRYKNHQITNINWIVEVRAARRVRALPEKRRSHNGNHAPRSSYGRSPWCDVYERGFRLECVLSGRSTGRYATASGVISGEGIASCEWEVGLLGGGCLASPLTNGPNGGSSWSVRPRISLSSICRISDNSPRVLTAPRKMTKLRQFGRSGLR
jgi:hypothetical protein